MTRFLKLLMLPTAEERFRFINRCGRKIFLEMMDDSTQIGIDYFAEFSSLIQ